MSLCSTRLNWVRHNQRIFEDWKEDCFYKTHGKSVLVQALANFGVSSSLTWAINSARSFFLLLYGKRSMQCSTLDDLRHMQLATTTDKDAAMLPPTEDAASD